MKPLLPVSVSGQFMMELPSDLDLPRNSGSVDDLVLIHLERAGTRDAGITLRTALLLNGSNSS